jgi:hypothetical protein
MITKHLWWIKQLSMEETATVVLARSRLTHDPQTLREFATGDFLPFVASTFAARSKTQAYYQYGVKTFSRTTSSPTNR